MHSSPRIAKASAANVFEPTNQLNVDHRKTTATRLFSQAEILVVGQAQATQYVAFAREYFRMHQLGECYRHKF
jgi:hypothetical protein